MSALILPKDVELKLHLLLTAIHLNLKENTMAWMSLRPLLRFCPQRPEVWPLLCAIVSRSDNIVQDFRKFMLRSAKRTHFGVILSVMVCV